MLCCDTMYKAFSFIKCLTLIIKCVILFSINIYIPNLMPGRCYQKRQHAAIMGSISLVNHYWNHNFIKPVITTVSYIFHIVKTDVYDIY